MALQPYDLKSERQGTDVFTAGLHRLLATALSEKALTWTALAGGMLCWGYALAHPDTLRLIAAGGYSVSIYLPMLFRKG